MIHVNLGDKDRGGLELGITKRMCLNLVLNVARERNPSFLLIDSHLFCVIA
jgi:hypothetical protein